MDSGNSASLHSSTAAAAHEDHHDHSTQSMSSFFNHIHHQPTFFDPSYFSFSNSTNLTAFGAPQNYYLHAQPPVSSNTNMAPGSNHHQVGVSMKNPKKRTRASKRTPTTVLTTDTSNFRQMVQEFTGIPTAPFSSYSRRFDLTARGGIGRLPPSHIHRFQTQNPIFLDTTTSDNQELDVSCWFPSSSTQWRGPNEDEYMLNTSNVHHLIHMDLKTVISSRDGGDQAQDNVDSWVLPF
ncbi:hypothetical protein L1987_13688 [Smallanthus sonchifolius]|uniref:Uncharacterized protein n=1 Tax=Smallanthus sonchifolius TaxID=185202 RepID=A0ACB9JJC5_9ASTR|nr:hypothetical protein L1987_13688 [Smallanthus sonchifolius]